MSLVDLASDVKPHLGMASGATSAQVDAQLLGLIDAAQFVIEDICGPILPATYTEYYDGGNGIIVTRHRPIITVTSVVEFRGPIEFVLTQVADSHLGTPWSYTFEPYGRIVRRVTGGETIPFPPWPASVQVVYEAGYATVPANVRYAALEFIRHNFLMTQQGGRPAFGGVDDVPAPHPTGFAVPARVLELLEPHKRFPSVA